MGIRRRLEQLEGLLTEDLKEPRALCEMTDAQLLRILAHETGKTEEELTRELQLKLLSKEKETDDAI